MNADQLVLLADALADSVSALDRLRQLPLSKSGRHFDRVEAISSHLQNIKSTLTEVDLSLKEFQLQVTNWSTSGLNVGRAIGRIEQLVMLLISGRQKAQTSTGSQRFAQAQLLTIALYDALIQQLLSWMKRTSQELKNALNVQKSTDKTSALTVTINSELNLTCPSQLAALAQEIQTILASSHSKALITSSTHQSDFRDTPNVIDVLTATIIGLELAQFI